MPTRYITLAPNTATPLPNCPAYDRVAVVHSGNVTDSVYVDTTGNTAVIPSDTTGGVNHTVKMVPAGWRRVIKTPRADTGGTQSSLSLKCASGAVLELEFP